MKRIQFCFILLFFLSICGCSNIILNEEKSSSNSITFSFDNSIITNRTIAPQSYDFDYSKIYNIKLSGYQKEEGVWASNASISKNYTTYKSFVDEHLSLAEGDWKFDIEVSFTGFDDILLDTKEVYISSGSTINVLFDIASEYSVDITIYVPTSENITYASYVFQTISTWYSASKSGNMTIGTPVTTGEYNGYTPVILKAKYPEDSTDYLFTVTFKNNSNVLGYFSDTITLENRRCAKKVTKIDTIGNSNVYKVNLNYPINPLTETIRWNTITKTFLQDYCYQLPTKISDFANDYYDYCLEGWYTNPDYSGEKVCISTQEEEQSYYARFVIVGIKNISLTSSFILGEKFSNQKDNYEIYQYGDTDVTSIIISPELIDEEVEEIVTNDLTLQTSDMNKKVIRVRNKYYADCYRDYTFTYRKKLTVAYYAAIIPYFEAGTYTIQPFYEATKEDYLALIKAIKNNNNIKINLDLSCVTGLTSIPAPSDYTTKLTNILSFILPLDTIEIESNAFSDWTELVEIVLPQSLQTIRSFAFYNNTNLTGELYIPKNVDNIELYSFINTFNFSSINISSQNKSYKTENGLIITKDNKRLVALCSQIQFENYNCIVPDGIEIIGHYAFAYSTISYIHIPSTCIELGSSVFMSSSIESITLPYSVNKIGASIFNQASKLQLADFSQTTITNIPMLAFFYCSNLKTIIMPSEYTKEEYAIYMCSPQVIVANKSI